MARDVNASEEYKIFISHFVEKDDRFKALYLNKKEEIDRSFIERDMSYLEILSVLNKINQNPQLRDPSAFTGDVYEELSAKFLNALMRLIRVNPTQLINMTKRYQEGKVITEPQKPTLPKIVELKEQTNVHSDAQNDEDEYIDIASTPEKASDEETGENEQSEPQEAENQEEPKEDDTPEGLEDGGYPMDAGDYDPRGFEREDDDDGFGDDEQESKEDESDAGEVQAAQNKEEYQDDKRAEDDTEDEIFVNKDEADFDGHEEYDGSDEGNEDDMPSEEEETIYAPEPMPQRREPKQANKPKIYTTANFKFRNESDYNKSFDRDESDYEDEIPLVDMITIEKTLMAREELPVKVIMNFMLEQAKKTQMLEKRLALAEAKLPQTGSLDIGRMYKVYDDRIELYKNNRHFKTVPNRFANFGVDTQASAMNGVVQYEGNFWVVGLSNSITVSDDIEVSSFGVNPHKFEEILKKYLTGL